LAESGAITGPRLLCAGRTLDLSTPAIMGVINTTPDSFSDGGHLYSNRRLDLDLALERARAMVAEGARILDIGGESTRPGAAPVSEQEEMDRVLPVVELICGELDVIVSVDTSTPSVMTAAAGLGAGLLNDVRALSREGAIQAAFSTNLPVCLMHMQGAPATMQVSPGYVDVVAEVAEYLQSRVAACEAQGMAREKLILDPGFGFGKTLAHNLALVRGLPELARLGPPLLVGFSRKSLIGQLLDRDVEQRLPASLALAVLAAQRGARIIRTHDVAATVDAVAMTVAVEGF
jgi:dihydropteroate synthase